MSSQTAAQMVMPTPQPATTQLVITYIPPQTSLPHSGGDHFVDKTGDHVWNVTEGRELTELEELDLYYDFDYESEEQEEDSIPIRSGFDDDSDEEMYARFPFLGGGATSI